MVEVFGGFGEVAVFEVWVWVVRVRMRKLQRMR
jgi:hypothetical protein